MSGAAGGRVRIEDLERFVTATFERCRVPAVAAAEASRALCYADLVGMDTHGVANLARIYIGGIESGQIDPTATAEIVRERGGAATIDARGGLGLVAGTRAMDEAVERAAEHGLGAVAVRGSSHMGSAGYYATRALERGMAGLALTNLGAQRIVRPPGGAEPVLGTNPISFAAPAGQLPPFVLDMSTTVVSTGQVRAAAARGEEIPPGWLVDSEGRGVTDPNAYDEGRGHLAWLGGSPATGAYKGFGLGLLVEVLAGALPGATTAPTASEGDVDRDIGHFFLALDVEAFRPLGDFRAGMDAMLGALLDSRPAGEAAVSYAGHPEARQADVRRREGVPLAAHVAASLADLAERLGVEPPAGLPVVSGGGRG